MPLTSTLDICVCGPLHEQAMASLRSSGGVNLTLADADHDQEAPWQIPPAVLKTVEIVLAPTVPSNLDAAPSLRLLQIPSAGYEHLLGLDLPGRNIRVCNAAGVFD